MEGDAGPQGLSELTWGDMLRYGSAAPRERSGCETKQRRVYAALRPRRRADEGSRCQWVNVSSDSCTTVLPSVRQVLGTVMRKYVSRKSR